MLVGRFSTVEIGKEKGPNADTTASTYLTRSHNLLKKKRRRFHSDDDRLASLGPGRFEQFGAVDCEKSDDESVTSK